MPLLSIVVPTRNRRYYCRHLIESILSFDYCDFELVIQDNSDSDDFVADLNSEISDERLICRHTPPPLSSIANFNLALGLARGEYVCLIGDDDGINPAIFRVVEVARDLGIPAIRPELNAIFRWPDACQVLSGLKGIDGQVEVSRVSGAVSVKKTAGELTQLLKDGCQDYLQRYLPKVYHGIVRREFIEAIRERTGRYVGGLSPDIYLAVSLALIIDRVVVVDFPLTIAGVGGIALRDHHRDFDVLESAPHFRDRGVYRWSEEVPRFYSSETIWADSALAAMRDWGRFDLVRKFRLAPLATRLTRRYPSRKNLFFEHYRSSFNRNGSLGSMLNSILWCWAMLWSRWKAFLVRAIKWTGRSGRRLLGLGVKTTVLEKRSGIREIRAATSVICDILTQQPVRVEDVAKTVAALGDVFREPSARGSR